MLSNAELLVDRRALRRRLSLWRALAVIAVIGAVIFAGVIATRESTGGSQHVARITLSGMITGARPTLELLKRLEDAASVRGVIVSIDSPGGTVTGSEDVYAAIRSLAGKKPTVAVINMLGASGAYIAAMGAERIMARQTSLVGSIGVIMQFPNITGLMDRVGVKMDEIKSSPLKASPNPFEPTSPAAREAMAAVVGDSYAWFRDLVRTRRGIEGEALAQVADGRIFTGRQALPLRLVDQLGDETDAVRWMESARGLAKGLPVRQWRPREESRLSLLNAVGALARAMGLETLASAIEASSIVTPPGGLMAVWTGPASQ